MTTSARSEPGRRPTKALTLIDGGLSDGAPGDVGGERVVPLDSSRSLAAAAVVQRALGSSVDRKDVRRLMGTTPEVEAFVMRLGGFMTDLVPGAEVGKSLLQEVLEVANLAYLSAGAFPEAGVHIARFLAGGVAAAARGLLYVTVDGVDAQGGRVRWSVLDGSLADFVAKWGCVQLVFAQRGLASRAERFAMRNILVASTLHFEDVVAIERAGIDYRTFEPY